MSPADVWPFKSRELKPGSVWVSGANKHQAVICVAYVRAVWRGPFFDVAEDARGAADAKFAELVKAELRAAP